MIPTTAQDQVNASICEWFGVDSTLMPLIFPNLVNFKSDTSLESAYLQGLFVS